MPHLLNAPEKSHNRKFLFLNLVCNTSEQLMAIELSIGWKNLKFHEFPETFDMVAVDSRLTYDK